jgi:hypothetical protein
MEKYEVFLLFQRRTRENEKKTEKKRLFYFVVKLFL